MENLLTCSPFFVSVAEAVCTSTSFGDVLGSACGILGPALVHGKSWEVLVQVFGKSWGQLWSIGSVGEVLGNPGASSGSWEVLGSLAVSSGKSCDDVAHHKLCSSCSLGDGAQGRN